LSYSLSKSDTTPVLQFQNKPLGGPNLYHLLTASKAVYNLKFIAATCPELEISNQEVPLQYRNRPLGDPKSNRFQVSTRPTHIPNINTIHPGVLELWWSSTNRHTYKRYPKYNVL